MTSLSDTLSSTVNRFTHVDLSEFDVRRLQDLDDKVVAAARDAAYITIGLGVLAIQQAQVRRRELAKVLSDRLGKDQYDELVSTLERRLNGLDERFDAFEAKLDQTVERLEDRLPGQAAQFVGQAHDVAKAARKQVRGLIKSAA